MLRMLSPAESAERRVREASKLAALVFLAADWGWYDTSFKPPDSKSIAAAIRELIYEMRSAGNSALESGRLRVEEGERGIQILLDLALLSEAEAKTFNLTTGVADCPEGARICAHPEMVPTRWNQPEPAPVEMVGPCEHNMCCPICGYGWSCTPDPCDGNVFTRSCIRGNES